jgi:hypothetical protein
VRGYALVGTSERQSQWVRRRALRFGGRVAGGMASRRYPPDLRRFFMLRLRDAVDLSRSPAPEQVHAHLNVDRSVRNGTGALPLVAHIHGVSALVGSPGWYGEVNAPAGKRATALTRLGGTVVHRAPNHTLTWLTGADVERLTVVFR